MEIERKWEISGFPEGLEQIDAARMEQSYLTTRPVVRIRRGSQDALYRSGRFPGSSASRGRAPSRGRRSRWRFPRETMRGSRR